MFGVRNGAACLEALECRVLLCGEHDSGLAGMALASAGAADETVSWRKQAADLKAQSLAGKASHVGGEPLAPAPAPVGGGISAAAQRLPDLTPWASQEEGFVYDWVLDNNEMPGRKLLRLSTAIANIGAGPLELRGSTTHADGTQDVLQRIYDTQGAPTDRLAGQFVYHAAHSHVHFEQFTEFRLRAVLPGDGVGPEVAASDKVSFCLLDVEEFDGALPGSPASSVYNSCGSVQGISVGWADVYSRNLEGQWIDITTLPFGQYWLEVVTDPADRILESDETNNVTRIKINYNAPPTGDVGGTAATAQSLGTIPVTVNSDVYAEEDSDWFSFAAAAGQTYVFETVDNGDPGALEDTHLELYSPNGTTQLREDDDGGAGLFSKITWTAPASGVYYVVVSAVSGSGTYRLNVNYQAPPPPDDHGNIPTTSTAVAAPTQAPVAGVLEQEEDVDYFRFSATAGVSYVFETQLGTLEDSVLYLYGVDGTTELEFDDDSGSELRASRIEWTAPDSGTYYLAVRGYEEDQTGSYSLTIEDDRPVPDDHGDSAGSATLVSVNTRTPGVIGPSGDADWFKFAATAGTAYSFTTLLGTLSDGILALAGPDGTTQLLANDNGAGDGAARILWTAPASGVYFVSVRGFSTARGDYELLVANNTSLPAGWQTQGVGAQAVPGWASHSGGAFTVQGSGDDIGGAADGFQFVYQQIVGDGEIIARVADLHDTGLEAKAGLMIRATLDAGSPHAMAMLAPGAGAAMHFRQLVDTPTTTETFEPVAAPVWLKLARLGGTFMAYWSADGQTWNLLGQANVPMPQTVFIGLALGSGEAGVLNTSTFDSVRVDSATPGAPTGLAVGAFGANRVRVTWQAPQGTIDGFEVQRSINGGPWEIVGTPATHGPTARSYTDGSAEEPVEAATNYAYRVRAVRGQNFSAFSDTVSFTTPSQGINGTDNGDAFRLRLSPDGQSVEIYVNVPPGGTPTSTVPRANLQPLSISGGLGNDTLEIDFANGDPLPAGGVDFDGGGGTDTVLARAGATALDLSVSATQISLQPLDAAAVRPFDVEAVRLEGGAGGDTLRQVSQPPQQVTYVPGGGSNRLSVEGGTFVLGSDVPGLAVEVADGAAVEFGSTQHLASLALFGNGRARMLPQAAGGERVLRLGALNMSPGSRLDLGAHGMILDDPAQLDTVLARIGSARNGGAWDGAGITSSSLTAGGVRGLAAAVNGESGGLLHTTFRGEAVNGSAVLVLYTFDGDSNLDGRVNISDFFRIDVGRAMRQTRYAGGDFNFSGGVANGDDYMLIDRAFLGQGQPAAAAPPVAPAALAGAFSARPVAGDETDEDDLFGGGEGVL